ncbi:MAG TPA: M28 family peptidase [Anaerolineae bacterium]|nr:M28 family peptidase [Anaerolineae bacterium]
MFLLSGSRLYAHVQRFITNVGPRPAGSPAEAAARRALEEYLHQQAITQTEQLSFSTTNTWGYGTIIPLLMALAGQFLPIRSRPLRATLSLVAAHQFWLTLHGQMRWQLLYRCYPQSQGGALIARIPSKHPSTRTVVLIGHLDSNKHRLTFSPRLKHQLRLSSSSLLLTLLGNALASLDGHTLARTLTAGYLGCGVAVMLADELGPYIEGANDNGSAVACVLGLGEQAVATPLDHTEVWLAFTGSEEVSHDGLNVFLDRYGTQLADAYFIDFEMVGKGTIHFIRRHHGLTYLTHYQPDSESLAIATQVATEHPELAVTEREVVIFEEVATLRRRGFRGLCLVGVEEDGLAANWHQRTDTLDQIDSQALEHAAQFAWHMIQEIDKE